MAKPKKQKRPALPPKASRAAVDVARNAIAKPPPGNAKAALYLCVPFAEKETARNLGARWDSQVKFWFVPHGEDIFKFQRWWPLDLALAAQHLPRAPLHPPTE